MKKPIKKPKLKPIPRFKTEDEEAKFWLTHDSTEYVDWSKAQLVTFPNLKPSTQTISLRLPKAMLNELKVLANARDVPYQSLMKMLLAQALKQEAAPRKK
jgi:predicted DNA binding CopG/RHH family protein